MCVASYGYMGDLLRISEKLRWLGPARYNYAGALVMALGLSYEAHVSYLPAHRWVPYLHLLTFRPISDCNCIVRACCML